MRKISILFYLFIFSFYLFAQEAINPNRPANYPEISDVPSIEWLKQAKNQKPNRADWWREARFGMFVHWGVSSVLGGSWHGRAYQGYAEHIQRVAKIPIPVYKKEVTGAFNPEKFNADTWIKLAKQTGMGYFIITAKHHDGVALFDSKVSDNNVVKASPWKHDPMPDLRAACKKYGVKFGFYYSQAFDWGEENGAGNDWDYQNPGGDRLLHGSDWWIDYPEFLAKTREYVDKKAIPQILELINQYHPDILWFDTPHKIPDEENLRILAAIRKADPNIVINGRLFKQPKYHELVDYINTGDKPGEFVPQKRDWEGIPTTNNSFGYNQNDTTHKSPLHFVRLLAKASAFGGNLLLNMGPMANGEVDPKDVSIFNRIGNWMNVNKESIRGTTKSILPSQTWGVSTTKKNTIYLHVFNWPKDGKILVSGLKSNAKSVRILSATSVKAVVKRLNPLDIEISGLPANMPDTANTVIALEFASVPKTDPNVYVPAIKQTRINCTDAKIEGGLNYQAGRNAGDQWIVNWKTIGDAATWSFRTNETTTFDVELVYDVPGAIQEAKKVEGDAGKEQVVIQKGGGGTFTLTIGNQTFTKVVTENRTVSDKIGQITLKAGKHDARLVLKELTGVELFRVRFLVFKPATKNLK